MIPALVSLKSLIKTKLYHIDYPLFRLHYQATVAALLGFCLILTAKILFGDTIDCMSRTEGRDEFYDNLCYSQGTFTTYAIDGEDFDQATPACQQSRLLNQTILHKIFNINDLCFASSIRYTYSGIMVPRESDQLMSTTLWHRYYQYIPIILFLQAIFFYFPHYLWKIWENGVVGSICKQLHDNRFAPIEYIESNYHMLDYLQNCFTLYRSLVFKYYFCHLLLVINLIGQIIALNAVFNNQFVTYGIDVFHYLFIDSQLYGLRGDQNINDLNNPMDFVFPKVTSCTIQINSQGGKKPDDYQFLCVLPLNILHDKFYLILWFWFLILAIVTVLQIVFDILYTILPPLRVFLFKKRYGTYLSDGNKHSSSLSELFILDLIGSNSDKFAFSALLRKLKREDWMADPLENQSLV